MKTAEEAAKSQQNESAAFTYYSSKYSRVCSNIDLIVSGIVNYFLIPKSFYALIGQWSEFI